MRSPLVALSSAYQVERNPSPTHTVTVVDDRFEAGTLTAWAYPIGMPQSLGIAVTISVEKPGDEREGVPTATIHANHRDALSVSLVDGKLIIDTKSCKLTRNESTGLYEIALR